MKVKAIRDFVSIIGGLVIRVNVDQEIELPEGADWITAGLAVPIREDEQEAAVSEAPEAAVVEKPRTTRRRKTTAKREPEK